MKKIILMLLLGVAFAFSQTQIFTQDANNKYKSYNAATTGDTLVTKAAQASAGTVDYPDLGAYLVGVFIGTPIARDTIIFLNGVDTVTKIIGAYTDTIPRWYPVGARLDTSLIVIKKKASHNTVIFQTRRLN